MKALPPHARRVLPIAGVVVFWLLLIPRLVPAPSWDLGVFFSVADRLVAGDALYAGVWDNKDPLFFLTLAVSRGISPFGPAVLEVAWMLAASAASWRLAAWAGCTRHPAALVGFVITPLILTGAFYVAGYTHLPGATLTLVALWLLLTRRVVGAGLVMGLVPLFKIAFGPVVVAVFAVVLIARRGAGLTRALLGAVASVSAVALLLAARQELNPYLNSLRLNVAYSGTLAAGSGGGVIGHVRLVIAVPGAWAVLLSIVVALLLAAPRPPVADPDPPAPATAAPPLMWLGALSALAAALVVLAATGLWFHHLQVLYVPAVLAAVAASKAVAERFRPSALVGIALGLCGGLLLGGPVPTAYLRAIPSVSAALASEAATSPLSRALLASGSPGTYARVGIGDHDGHAHGLASWRLVCARFHQYPFDPDQALTELTDCLPRADAILVSESAVPQPGAATWNAFMARVETLLAANYVCETVEGGRLCLRVDR